MKSLTTNYMEELTNNNRMTSLQIAEITGKRHSDVLEAIRNMEDAWADVTGRKFPLSEYKDATGRKLPMYKLTKTECLYVATKFNDEARARLVLRWEQLEEEKRVPLSPAELILRQSLLLVDHEKRMSGMEKKIELLEAKATTRPDYFTIVGYCKLHGIEAGLKMAASLGGKASRLCKARGIAIDSMPDPRFGYVNLYPGNVLEEILEYSLTTNK
jgi:predicted transcriptional regulator